MHLIDWIVEPFRYEFMQRGLLAAALLGVSGGLLGGFLVLRRLSLMGDALAHSLLPGIGLAYLLFGTHTLALFLGALFAGLLTSLGSALLSRLTRIKEDAAFGSLFVLFFGVGVILVHLARTRLNLMHFLFGNVLGVGPGDLGLTGAITALTLLTIGLFHRHLLLETFDPVFYRATGGRGSWVHLGLLALVVLNLVSALQTMGIVLALGLFLLPATSAFMWSDSLRHIFLLSSVLGVLSAFGGILISYHGGLPSGPSIVLCLGLVFLGSVLGSPRYGLLAKFFNKGA